MLAIATASAASSAIVTPNPNPASLVPTDWVVPVARPVAPGRGLGAGRDIEAWTVDITAAGLGEEALRRGSRTPPDEGRGGSTPLPQEDVREDDDCVREPRRPARAVAVTELPLVVAGAPIPLLLMMMRPFLLTVLKPPRRFTLSLSLSFTFGS